MSSTEIALRGGTGTGMEVFQTGRATMSLTGLVVAEDATLEELLSVAAGLGAVTDAASFGIGDLASAIRRSDPAAYRQWIGLPNPVKGLDNKTVKVYMAVADFYSHEQRARHLGRGCSFSHFSRVRRYGPELAEHWLEQASENGWSLKEMEERIDGGTAGSDVVPSLPVEPVSIRGEWTWLGPPEEPGRHLLYCGDCTDPGIYAQAVAALGEKIACVWTDPPYGVEYVGKTEDALTIQNDGADDLRDLLDRSWAALKTALVPSAAIYVAGPTGDNASDFLDSIKGAGFRYKQMLVWVKNTIVLGRQDYQLQHEGIYYAHAEGPPAGRRPGHDDKQWYGGDNQSSVFAVDKPSASREHPTMKPVKLIIPALENSSRPGEVVADIFAGSGSTMIAADQIGRRAFLVEYDPAYADVIKKRYADYLVARSQGVVEEHEIPEVAGPVTTMPEE